MHPQPRSKPPANIMPQKRVSDDKQKIQNKDDVLLRGDAQDQFAITPRFSSSARQSRQPRSAPRPPAGLPAATPTRSFLKPAHPQGEDVFDKSQSDPGEDDVMLLDELGANSWSDDLTLSPKRRRLNSHHNVDITPVRRLAEAFARPALPPASHRQQDLNTKQRFISSSALSPMSTQGRSGIPSFVARPSQPRESNDVPLPDAFSPHRQGDRYTAGGMASTLQQWVLETGQAAVQARRNATRAIEQPYLMKVTVKAVELETTTMTLLHGSIDDGRSIDVILISDGTRQQTSSGSTLAPEMLVGLKEPCWPLALASKHWVVCVEWKILH